MTIGRNKATRYHRVKVVTIAQGAALSAEIDLEDFASMGLFMPAAWTTADLGLQVSPTSGGTYYPLLDTKNGYGTDVNIDGATASKAYIVPLHLFPFRFVKLWSTDGAGGDTNQAAARTLTVVLKS
jgi:hypothetical protein